MRHTIAAIALAIACLSSPAQSQTVWEPSQGFPVDWDYTLIGDYNYTYAGHDGDSMFFRTGGPPPAVVYYDAPPAEWAAAVATGDFSVYAEMLIRPGPYLWITDPSVGLATIVAATGSVEFRLEFLPDRISLGGGTLSGVTEHVMDTTDAIHVYEIYVTGNHAVIWVDGVPRLDATSSTTTTEQFFRFGDIYDENFGESRWHWLAFGADGAVPVASSSVSGLKSRYGH